MHGLCYFWMLMSRDEWQRRAQQVDSGPMMGNHWENTDGFLAAQRVTFKCCPVVCLHLHGRVSGGGLQTYSQLLGQPGPHPPKLWSVRDQAGCGARHSRSTPGDSSSPLHWAPQLPFHKSAGLPGFQTGSLPLAPRPPQQVQDKLRLKVKPQEAGGGSRWEVQRKSPNVNP